MPAGQLAQLVKALGSISKGPGFDLAPTHITCLLSPQSAIKNVFKSLFIFDFKCLAAMPILHKVAGAMSYKPVTPWLIVLSINHILGRVPTIKVLKAYL